MSLDADLLKAFKGALHNSITADWGVSWMPSGVLPLDHAIGSVSGKGGFGEGRIHEIYGDWSTGKTLMLYEWLIHVQMVLGGKSILFEGEGGFAPKWYQSLGGILDPKDKRTLLYYPNLETAEDFFEGVMTIIKVIKKNGFTGPVAIGLDSIASMGTKHLQKEGTKGSRDMTKAFVMDQGTKLIVSHLHGTRIAVVATNQTRKVVGAQRWEPTHTPGGRAWPYFSSARVELEYDGGPSGSLIMSGTEKEQVKVGRWVRGEIMKNKMAPPFSKFKLPLYVRPNHIHPVFSNALTMVGVDKEQALLEWYLGPESRFGELQEPVLTMGGAGRITLNEAVTGMKVKTFYKRDWLKLLETFPQLLTMNPFAPPEPPKPPKKRKKR